MCWPCEDWITFHRVPVPLPCRPIVREDRAVSVCLPTLPVSEDLSLPFNLTLLNALISSLASCHPFTHSIAQLLVKTNKEDICVLSEKGKVGILPSHVSAAVVLSEHLPRPGIRTPDLPALSWQVLSFRPARCCEWRQSREHFVLL